MAAVHFSAIPCERYTAHEVQGKKPYFKIFVFVLTILCMLGLKICGIFMSVVKFLRTKTHG